MSKNIILCCDGTNNQFDGDHTLVIRTYKVASHNATQATFYHPGVGTMPESWLRTQFAKRWSLIEGLAFGRGFIPNIEDAYRYLMNTYQPGDKIFVFGFSRGAYTVRALAGMLHSVGLLRSGQENLVPYAVRYWRKDFGSKSPGGKLCAEFKTALAIECPIHFLGVWDTVGSVGFINNFRTFPFTYKNPSVAHIRHAVSIDERRSCFRQNLMAPAFEEQDVKNVWFAGVHSDVGGGYPEKEAGLAKLTFEWMMREAAKQGMEIDDKLYQKELGCLGSMPSASDVLHTSLKGGWWFIEALPDRRYSFKDHKRHWHLFNANEPRNILENASQPYVYIHSSVLDRLRLCPNYRPFNIPNDSGVLQSKFKIEN